MKALQTMISAIIQVGAVTLLSLGWWSITKQKETPFLQWLGLKKPTVSNKTAFATAFLLTAVLLSLLSFVIIPWLTKDAELAVSEYAGQGAAALAPAFIYAFLQTGLSEEIFFRGLLGKRFIAHLGFGASNILQAGLFGLLHAVMFKTAVGSANAFAIAMYTAATGWLMGYMNEKHCDGSIIPSWVLHGIGNFVTAVAAAFDLLG